MTALKGRGALSRTRHRFDQRPIEATDEEREAQAGMAPDTELRPVTARSIVSRNTSPDIPFNLSINPYQGCEHGCVYCYARPSHSYLDLSPGLDFESKIFYKPNAVELLLAEWRKPGYRCEPVTIGANTDPYQPAERQLGITRRLLETFLAQHHPVSLISKGTLMQRDLDLLGELAARNLCSVAISIPTRDNALKRILEPRVPSAASRFRLLAALRDAGVPTTLLLAPVIPAVNDHEIEAILAEAADCGVGRAHWVLLRLPHEVGAIFREWLETHFPQRARHVMSLLRQAGGGRDYDARFHHRQTGSGPYAGLIGQRFRAACAHHGIVTGRGPQTLDVSAFHRPGTSTQLTFGFGS